MTRQEFYKNVLMWAEKRNIIKGSTPEHQTIKLGEELGELCAGVSRGDLALIKDSIGDCMVVVTILRAMVGATDTLEDESSNAQLPFGDDIKRSAALIVMRRMGEIAQCIFLNANELVTLATLRAFYQELEALCGAYNIDITECYEAAWNDIKDRKGLIVDGVFLKQADIEKKLAELDAKLSELVDLDDDISLEASELALEAALWQDRLVACMK